MAQTSLPDETIATEAADTATAAAGAADAAAESAPLPPPQGDPIQVAVRLSDGRNISIASGMDGKSSAAHV